MGIINTQTLGALSGYQKIENVFYAFGYSIPAENDGLCMWPTKFKREMARRIKSGKLSIKSVKNGCKVSDQTANQWWQEFGGVKKKKPLSNKLTNKSFSEIKVMDAQPKTATVRNDIVLKRGDVELKIPPNYPV